MADAQTIKKTVEQAAAATIRTQSEAVQATAQRVEAAAETVQVQAEKIQATGAQALRDGLEKTTASFAELNAQSKQNLEALTASAAAAQKGVEALSAQALNYSKTSWENATAAAQTIAKARSVQELIDRAADLLRQVGDGSLHVGSLQDDRDPDRLGQGQPAADQRAGHRLGREAPGRPLRRPGSGRSVGSAIH